jgi:hypothetical protein
MPTVKAPSPEQHVGIHMPTAYIRRITLESSGTNGMEAEIQVVLKDFLRGKDLFSDDMGFLKHLKIKLYQVTSPKIYQDIVSGGPTAFTAAASAKSKFLKQIAISPFDYLGKDIAPSHRTFARSKDAAGNEFEDFVYQVRFEIQGANPKHLSYFARTEIDMSSASEGENIKSIDASGLMGTICGSVTAEQVISLGKVQREAFSFVVADPRGSRGSFKGSLWAGPVHYHKTGEYMGGAMHTKNPHPVLRRDQSLNPKIIDKRSYSMLDSKGFLLSLDQARDNNAPKDLYAEKFLNTREENYFSDPFMARNELGGVSLTFSFDHLGYISKETRFRGLFSSNPSLVANFASFFPLTNVEIFRHRVRTRSDKNIKSTNTLGTPRLPTEIIEGQTRVAMKAPGTNIDRFSYTWPVVSQDRPSNGHQIKGQSPKIQQDSSYTNVLESVQITADNSVKSWTLSDTDYSTLSTGEYQYEVVLTLEDRTSSLMDQASVTMNSAIKLMKQYETASKLEENYDAVHYKFHKSFKNRSKKYRWLQAAMSFIDTVEVFYGRVGSDFRDSLALLINPITGTPDGITQVLAMMNDLNSKIRSVSPNRNQPSTHRKKSSKLLQNSTNRNRQIEIRKRFDEVYNAHNPQDGLMYLGETPVVTSDAQGIKRLTAAEYSRRVDLERDKYFSNGAANSVRSIVPRLTTGAVPADQSQIFLNNIEKTQTLYLTPSSIRSGKKVLTLLDKGEELYDLEQYSLMTAKLLDRTTRTQKAKVEKNKEFSQAINNMFINEGISIDFDLLDRSVKRNIICEVVGSTKEGEDNYFIESSTILDSKNFNTKEMRNDTKQEYSVQDFDERENLIKEVGKEMLSSVVTSRGLVSSTSPRQLRQEGKTGFKLSMTKYDPEKNTSLLSKDKISKLSSLPMQNLSLIFSRSPVVRKNWHDLEIDLLKDGSYTEFYRYNYDAIMKVQYLEKYDNSSGKIQLKKPVWKDLTQNEYRKISQAGYSIMCKLEPYADSEFGIGQTNSLDVPIYNKYFILEGSTRAVTPEDEMQRPGEDFKSRINKFMYAWTPETVDYSRTVMVDHSRMFRDK